MLFPFLSFFPEIVLSLRLRHCYFSEENSFFLDFKRIFIISVPDAPLQGRLQIRPPKDADRAKRGRRDEELHQGDVLREQKEKGLVLFPQFLASRSNKRNNFDHFTALYEVLKHISRQVFVIFF